MPIGEGTLPPTAILGGTSQVDPITVKSIHDYVIAWIRYYYAEYDLGAQYSLSSQGPYISGHRASTPLNPAGPSQVELVFNPPLFGDGGRQGTTGPLQEKRWATSYTYPSSTIPQTNFQVIHPQPPSTPPESPLYDRARGQLYLNNGTTNLINADGIWNLVLDMVSKQTVISWCIHKFTVYGDGGNRGYYNPISYDVNRNVTATYNQVHRTRWTTNAITMRAVTPYGNPLQTDPNATFNAPNFVEQWSVDIAYGTKSFASRVDINSGNQPIAEGEMEILFVPPAFPQTIGSGIPRNNPSAATPTLRDGRITQPRIRHFLNRNNFSNLNRDEIVLRSDIVSLVQQATDRMRTADLSSTTYFERLVCHASCHGNCHSSRGRR